MSSEDEKTNPAVTADPDEILETEGSEADRLRGQLDAATKRIEDLMDRVKRAQADYENLERRAAREADEVRLIANEALFAAVLPVLDDFDHALAALAGESGEGVRQIHANLWRVLAGAGLEVLDPAGKPFDAYEHEVVGRVDDENLSDGTVKEVVQKGYRYRKKLLRAAKVVVVSRGDKHGENHRN